MKIIYAARTKRAKLNSAAASFLFFGRKFAASLKL